MFLLLSKLRKLFFFFCLCAVDFAEARVLDDKGNLLPQVFSIFHLLKPVLKPIPGCPEACLKALSSLQASPQQAHLLDLALIAKIFLKRPEGVERWDPQFQRKFHPYQTKAMKNLFREMGDLKKIEPMSPKPIDYLIVFGGLVERIHGRISYLISLYQKQKLNLGTQVQVILLASNRPLNLFEISQLRLMKSPASSLPKTEAQAIQWLWKNMKLPNGLHELGTSFVEYRAQFLQHKRSGILNQLQPTTVDNLKKWLSSKPFPGHCLVISNQPFVHYHKLVTERFFQQQPASTSQGWSLEVVGDTPKSKIAISDLFDNMARVLELEAQASTEKLSQTKP